MRIGLVVLEVGRRVGGLEVYETNLVQALARVDPDNEYRVFCLDPAVPEILQVKAANLHFEVLNAGRFKGVAFDIPRALAQAKLDLFHALFVPPPLTSVPYVFTHHGSEVIERPDFYPLALGLRMRFLFKRALKRARLVICVSNYVRDYLLNVRQIPLARLRTVYHGCDPRFRSVEKPAARKLVRDKYALNQPFILTIGRIEPRKNPVRVLRAYDRFRRSVLDAPRLVFVGMKTWSATEFDRTAAELGLRDSIAQLGDVSHDDLPSLYAASEFAVFASLWEGFGLPVLEAYAAGTPLITSRTTSLPEISGGACLLVDPNSVEEIARAMQSLHQDGPLRAKLVSQGRERASAFSWDQAARETLDAYRSVALQAK
jgi:glycosyltransferase involved in cell wall biosynthesis